MILVNDKQVEFTKFPEGTTSFRFSPHLPPRMFAQPMEPPIFSITWKYDNDEECILLWYLTNHIRENKAISTLVKDKTLIVIAHRLSTIRDAEQILVIDNGKLVQHGKHDELVLQEGIYQKYWNIRQNAKAWKVAQ